MPAETRTEPFVHLVDVSHDSALVAWGAFWFQRDSPAVPWRVVDDERLPSVAGRSAAIGAEAEPYGEAVVEVLDESGGARRASTDERSWAVVEGLRPDTDYRYRVVVGGREWAAGERWDWLPAERGGYDLVASGRSYDLRFRTPPAPDARVPVTFAVLGDYGVGITSDS